MTAYIAAYVVVTGDNRELTEPLPYAQGRLMPGSHMQRCMSSPPGWACRLWW